MLGWSDPRPLTEIIAPERARKLAGKPKLRTVADVLLNFPKTYLRAGSSQALEFYDDYTEGEMYTCLARIVSVEQRENYSNRGPQSYVRFVFDDGRARLESALFGAVRQHLRHLVVGADVLLYGKLSLYGERWQLKSPSYVVVNPGDEGAFGAFGALATIVDVAGSEDAAQALLSRPWIASYPRRAGTSTPELIAVVEKVISAGSGEPAEMLPTAGENTPPWPQGADGRPLLAFGQALREIHQPPAQGAQRAVERMKFNEALELQIVMALRRAESAERRGFACAAGELTQQLLATLPYELSAGQQEAWAAISGKLASPAPANVMLQGDVGSGKTTVAMLAMAQVIDAGYQCAFIAPTEVLAAQHARTLASLEGLQGVGITLLSGSQPQSVRQEALLNIVSGQASIVVGTHAVIQESVEFFRLGLVIVDEQHRFGVRQRDELRSRAPVDATPHMLVMTATPIPRSVAMTMFGDLTPVVLPGLPAGRGSIQTTVVPEFQTGWFERAWARMGEEIARGHQAYVVVSKIDGERGVEWWAEQIAARYLPQANIGVLHGRLPSENKDLLMREFAAGTVDVLVATTVIEVGVDVPNATMMFILDAENFGVSQLHQLRGRVGRGSADALCLLHTALSPEHPSLERLRVVAGTTDGFELAQFDLASRSEGDVLGDSQSGARVRRTRLLDLTTDGPLIEKARDYAAALVAYDEEHARQLVAGIDIEDQDFIERS